MWEWVYDILIYILIPGYHKWKLWLEEKQQHVPYFHNKARHLVQNPSDVKSLGYWRMGHHVVEGEQPAEEHCLSDRCSSIAKKKIVENHNT